jgi:transcriptional regulator with XRE-family HTH domain
LNTVQEKSSQKVDEIIIEGFGQRFKTIFPGLTYDQIGEKLGVKKSAVANYVKDRVPKISVLYKILEHTQVDLHWLLTGEGEGRFSVATVVPDGHNLDARIGELTSRLTNLESAFFRLIEGLSRSGATNLEFLDWVKAFKTENLNQPAEKKKAG